MNGDGGALASIERTKPDIVGRHRAVLDRKARIDPLLTDRVYDLLQAFRSLGQRHRVLHLVEAYIARAREYLVAPAHFFRPRHQPREQLVRGAQQKRRVGKKLVDAGKDAHICTATRAALIHLLGRARLRRLGLAEVERLAYGRLGIGKPEELEMPVLVDQGFEFLEQLGDRQREVALRQLVGRQHLDRDLRHQPQRAHRDPPGRKDLGILRL